MEGEHTPQNDLVPNVDSIFATEEKREVDVGQGVTFIIKTDFTYPEETRLAILGERIRRAMKKKDYDSDLLANASLEMLRIAVTDWQGVVGQNGKPIPYERSRIDRLRSAVALKVIDGITKILEEKRSKRTEWEKNKLPNDVALPGGEGSMPAGSGGNSIRPTDAGLAEGGGSVRPAGGLDIPGEIRDEPASPGAGSSTTSHTNSAGIAEPPPVT